MNTPIVDFVKDYAERKSVRFHMPGHKGVPILGPEPFDITEIDGADVLYSPNGIIVRSEDNATELFGSYHTFYSTEGSSLAIKAMLGVAVSNVKGRRPLILAARNAHKAFMYACALLDIDVCWLYGEKNDNLCACNINKNDVETALEDLKTLPDAVYITSPDYMGNRLDISAIAKACHSRNIPLLVDNAHGAYLAFTEPGCHPLQLGADACCDSAHKTLPVLTGGAYLHVSKNAPESFKDKGLIRNTLAIFASTSPSYLIMQSLDMANKYIKEGYKDSLEQHIAQIDDLKSVLTQHGYVIRNTEPLKIVIVANEYGYSGNELAKILRNNNIECEFADSDNVVLMSTPQNSSEDIDRLACVLIALPKKSPIPSTEEQMPSLCSVAKLSIREAVFSKRETVSIDSACGHICASPVVSCPPAIPIVVSGEIITEDHIFVLKAYGISKIEVCAE